MSNLGYIARIVRVGVQPAIGATVQLVDSRFQPVRIYNDAQGTDLYSDVGRMVTDNLGVVRCFVPAGQVYSLRLLDAAGVVMSIAEGIHPQQVVETGAAYITGIDVAGLLTPSQLAQYPIGVAAIGADGRVYDAAGNALATVSDADVTHSPILNDGQEIAPSFRALDFQGEGVHAGMDGNGTVHVVVPVHRNEVLNNGSIISSAADRFDFRGPVSVEAQGTQVTVIVDEPTHLSVRDASGQLTPGASSLTFTGDLDVSASNNDVTVSFTETPLTLRHHGSVVNANTNTLNIEGSGATVSSAGNTVTLTVPSTAVIAQDEGNSLGAVSTLNFTGAGVAASSPESGVVRVSVPQGAINIRRPDGASAVIAPNEVQFTGAGVSVTANSTGGVVVEVPGAPLPTPRILTSDHLLTADDLGACLVSMSATPITITVPAAGLPDAFAVSVVQGTDALVLFAREAGVVLDSYTHSLNTAGKNARATITRTGAASYVLEGQLTPPVNAVASVAGRTGDVQLTAADVAGVVRSVGGALPNAQGEVSLPDATNTTHGVVRLQGALGGTAEYPTALGYNDAIGLESDLLRKSDKGHTHTADEVSIPLASYSQAGLMIPTDKHKLDNLPTTIPVYTDKMAQDAAAASLSSQTLDIVHDANTGATTIDAPLSSTARAGLLSPFDKAKLDAYPAVPHAAVSYSDEQAQDAAAQLLTHTGHAGVTVAYDDVANRLTLEVPTASNTRAGLMAAADKQKLDALSTLPAPTYTDEQAQDAAAAMLVAGTHSGVTVAYDDIGNRLNLSVQQPNVTTNLSATATTSSVLVNSSTGSSAAIAAATQSAAGVMSAADKARLDQLSVNAGGYTDEQAQDAVAAALSAGVHSGINVTYNDVSNAINLSVPVATPSSSGLMSAEDKQKLDATTSTMTQEGAQDLVGLMFTSGVHSGVTAVYNDATGTVALSVSPTSAATQSVAGLMSAADKVKLDALAAPSEATVTTAGLMSAADKQKVNALPVTPVYQYTDEQAQDAAAQLLLTGNHVGVAVQYDDALNRVNLSVTGAAGATNLSTTTAATTLTVASSTGTSATLPAATASTAGVLTAADKQKLDAVAVGATAYTDENAQDAAAAALVAGTHAGITVSYNDATNAISLTVTGTGNSTVAPASTAVPVLTGSGVVGSSLSATTGSWNNAPTTFAYQWLRNGSAITGATQQSYTLVAADAGNTISVRVTATNSAGSTSAVSAATATISPASTAPANTSAPVIVGNIVLDSSVTALTGNWSGSPTNFTYQWKRNGVNISGATSNTYTIVVADQGTSLSVTVTAINSAGSGSATSAGYAVPGVSAAPSNTALPAVSGSVVVGATLSATSGAWTNSPISYAYQWLRNGTALTGATASSYVPQLADVAATLSVRVTASNMGGSVSATSVATVAVTSPPMNTALPQILGSASIGSTLSASPGSWEYNATTFAYQWRRGGGNISGATNATYVVDVADVGQALTVRVTATNAAGSNVATSQSVTPASAPTNSVAPSIVGTPSVNNVIGVSLGTWTGSPTFAYQWRRAGVNITGGTAANYTVQAADVGRALTCMVTATNGAGSLQVVTPSVLGQPAAVQTDVASNPITAAMTGSHATYNVGHPGSGQPHTLDTVPWCTLVAGDVVNIHYSATPYKIKFALRGQGTATDPIVVNGVTDANGNRPVIDYAGSTTAPLTVSPIASTIFTTTPQYGENLGGLIIKPGPNDDYYTYRPKNIKILNLELKGCRGGATYTTSSQGGSSTQTFSSAGGIYLMKAVDILIQNCVIYDHGFGVFMMAKDGLRAWACENVTMRYNRIYGNGTVNSWFDHGVYQQCISPVTEGNWFGVNRVGSLGSTFKDRSSRLIFRFNTIENSARNLDLVHSEEQSTDGVATMPDYGLDYVYGNVFINDYRINGGVTYAALHYGGDNLGEESPGMSTAAADALAALPYRRKLFFWNNTMVVNLDPAAPWANLTLFDLSTKSQTVTAWNNIWAVYGPQQPGVVSWIENAGTLNLIGTNQLYSPNNTVADTQASPAGRFAVNKTGTLLTTNPGLVDVANYDYSLLDTVSAPSGQNVTSQVAAVEGGALVASLPVEFSPRVRTSGVVARGSVNLGAMGSNPSAPQNVGAPPTITHSTVTVGSVFTAAVGGWSNSPTFSYQWQRDGVPISGATASTYTLVNADAGKAITVVVTATANGVNVSATSAAVNTTPLANAPSNTALPVISGTPAVANTLSASQGTWTNSPVSYTYEWFVDGVSAGAAASNSTFNVTNAHLGKAITVRVVASNVNGSGSAVSIAVNVSSSIDVFTFGSYSDGTLLSAIGPAGTWGSVYGSSENRFAVYNGLLRCLNGTGTWGHEVWRVDVTGAAQVAEAIVPVNRLLTGGSLLLSVNAGGVSSSWLTLTTTTISVTLQGTQVFSVAHGLDASTTQLKATIALSGGSMIVKLNGTTVYSTINAATDGHPSLTMYNSDAAGSQVAISSFGTASTQ